MLDRVGQQVGNYRLLRLLGRGGFADVYLGEHRYLKSAAALKMLRVLLSEKDEQSFLAEAQTLVRLRHTHIVRVLDFAIENSTPVFMMDYISGGSLQERHPRGSSLPLHTIVDYVTQIATALQYAHNQQVIHRDVKPENILLDADQHLVLGDFGLAILTSAPDMPSTQELAGTLPYTAPEQTRGKPCFASDQYALGVMTYEWIAGARPFEGRGIELIEQHCIVAPPPLHERCPDLPPAVEQVVLKALEKDPQQRYSSVTAFAHALQRSCEEVIQLDEDTQATAPLRAISRPSIPALPPSHSNLNTLGMVFFSAAPADKLVVARLVADLKQRGIFLSNDLPEKGSDEAGTLRHAIRSAHRVVVAVTPQTRSSRLVREHLHLAQVYQRRLVLVWLEGEGMATLLLDPTWHPLFQAMDVVDARGARYQTALAELLVCLREEASLSPAELSTHATTPEEPPEPRNPYKGLRAFRPHEATDFFGREALITAMTEQLNGPLEAERRGAAGTRLLALVGSSGSGKSSAMLAGLLPQLQSGALPSSQAWLYLEPMVPGARPLEALTLTLAPHFPDRAVKTIYEDLCDDSARGLHRLCTQLVKQPHNRVVLIIDQFEELFTQTVSTEEQRCFIDLLVTAAKEEHGPVLVLLTLRADFYDRPMSYPYLYRLLEAHHQSLLPMETHELRQVIEGPSALPDVQLTFEGNLVGDLLFEAQGQVGALPLLEFTLDQLFQRRAGHTLTMAAYRQIGGVKGALTKHAEAIYASLPSEEHRSFAQTLFMRLVNLGMTEHDTTRRRVALSELSLPNARQTALLREVTDTFIAARLLTANEVAGITTVEVSHEALIREWPRLSNWLREKRADIRLQQTISNDVNMWQQRGQPKDRLYQGSQLKEARAWAGRNKASEQEVAFLHASILRQMQFVVSVIVVFLLLVSSAGAAVWFFRQRPPDYTVVTNTNDDGFGSLRWAIKNADNGSTIKFASNVRGTIWLKSNDLNFASNLTIQGPGAAVLTISGDGYNIVVFDKMVVTMSDLSLKDSHTEKSRYGFLYNQGTLKLNHMIISNNTSSDTGIGGGLYNYSGTLSIANSTVSNNRAQYGGGIYNYSGILIISNSTISGNQAIGKDASGGGIYDGGPLTLTNATVSGNTAANTGGGITVFDSQATITSCTISGNTARNGGGLSIQKSHVKVGHSTVAGNHALVGADIVGAYEQN